MPSEPAQISPRIAAVDGIAGRAQSRIMTGDAIPSLIMQIVDELRAQGILITHRDGEWCVNFRGGSDATAYLTDDLQDAFEHGRTMALAGQPVAAEPVKRRRLWRRPKSAKAARRAMIRQHNRRLRARTLRKSREEA
jgi:hypothetical protein